MPPRVKLSKKERKLEKQKKNQEKKCILLLEYLEREIKYGNVTRRKHEKSWRELVMKIGLEKIRDDLEYTWQLFEWALDIKDCEISALMDELTNANEQYSLNLQNYNMATQQLLRSMTDNLKCLHEDFLNSLQNSKNSYHEKNMQYQQNFVEAQYSLKTLLYRMEVDSDNTCRDQMTRHFCLLESLAAAESQRESVEVIHIKKMTKMWNQSKTILNEHVSRSEIYTALTQKDKAALELSEMTIRRNLKRILYFVEVIKKLQAKLTFLYETDGEHLRQLFENHEEFTTYLFVLKDKLFKDYTLDNNRKRVLVYSSQKTLDKFNRIIRIGELMVRSMSVNRRYESSSEKVTPYPARDYNLKSSNSKMETMKGHLLMDKLFLFNQKMAAADASRVALLEEKRVLQLERMQLNKKFQEFCGCLDCTNKFPRPKREKKMRTFSYFERSKLTTFYRLNHQVGEDGATREKFRLMKKQMLEDEGKERHKMIQESIHNIN